MHLMNGKTLTKEITRTFCMLLCVVTLCTSFFLPRHALAGSEGTTNAKVVIRKEANAKSAAVQTLYKGEEVDILKTY